MERLAVKSSPTMINMSLLVLVFFVIINKKSLKGWLIQANNSLLLLTLFINITGIY